MSDCICDSGSLIGLTIASLSLEGLPVMMPGITWAVMEQSQIKVKKGKKGESDFKRQKKLETKD